MLQTLKLVFHMQSLENPQSDIHLCNRTVHSLQHERMAVWDLDNVEVLHYEIKTSYSLVMVASTMTVRMGWLLDSLV